MRRFFFGAMASLLVVGLPVALMAGESEDRAMATHIAQNLKASGQLRGYEVGVMCREGTAWLKGTVATGDQAEAALEVARQTDGVDYVVDLLTTREEASNSQAAMEASIVRQPQAAPNRSSVASAPMSRGASVARVDRSNFSVRENNSAMLTGGAAPAPRRANRIPASVQTPMPMAVSASAEMPGESYGQPIPAHVPGPGLARPVRYDSPNMPGYAWPSYASYPNYGALTYPKQYSPTAWPYIGPFYPYPQVPLGWRKVTLEWDDGWWMLDFKD